MIMGAPRECAIRFLVQPELVRQREHQPRADMLHLLLPGESVDLAVTTAADLPPGSLTDATVLRSANQLLHR